MLCSTTQSYQSEMIFLFLISEKKLHFLALHSAMLPNLHLKVANIMLQVRKLEEKKPMNIFPLAPSLLIPLFLSLCVI